MKTSKYHILCARILLFCFIAGQGMIYAHSHAGSSVLQGTHRLAKSAPQQTVQEKCYFCDVLHHNPMVISVQVFFNPVHLTRHLFKAVVFDFAVTQRLHSPGRAPPSLIS